MQNETSDCCADFPAGKTAARQTARCRLRAVSPAQWQQWGQAMASELFALPQWQNADSVFCFVSLVQEPDTTPILHRALAQGRQLFVPRITEVPGQMEAVSVADEAALAALLPNHLGIREPAPAHSATICPSARFSTRALAILPCLSADRFGCRLGRGGGYYDRFLAEFRGSTVLLCAAALLSDSPLPAEPHDILAKLVLTEHGPLTPQLRPKG